MSIIGRVKEKVTGYIDLYSRLFKLEFIGRTSNVLSYFIFLLIGLFISFCILLFLGLGIVEFFITIGLTKLAGFLLTILVYVLLLVIIVLLRRPITRFFGSKIIQVLTEGDDDGDSDKTGNN